MAWAGVYLHTKWHLDPSSDFVTTDMGRKLLGAVPLWGVGLGAHVTQCGQGGESTSIPSDILIHLAVWPQQTWAENWGWCPFGGRAGSPSNTMWPGWRSTSIPCFILIHPTIWPQYTNVIDGRTLLQATICKTVRPKTL